MDQQAAANLQFDPNATSVDSLIELFPDLGLFSAEDIVAWRDKNGRFPDESTLVSEVGLDPALAALVANEAACAPESKEVATKEAEVAAPAEAADSTDSASEETPANVDVPEPAQAADSTDPASEETPTAIANA